MDKKYTFSYSYTQPYNTFYGMTAPQIYQRLTNDEELAKLDAIDRKIDEMESYPEAEALIKNIFK